MTAKQLKGLHAPDGSTYVTLVDGAGALNPVGTASAVSGTVTTIGTPATYKHIAAGQATTAVKASAGTLYAITFNTNATATNVTTVYDNPSTSGTVIAIPAATALVGNTLTFGPGIAFANGLTIITATANGADMTVVYT